MRSQILESLVVRLFAFWLLVNGTSLLRAQGGNSIGNLPLGRPPGTNAPPDSNPPPIRLGPPEFPTHRPPHGLAPCICGPLVGNYMSNQLEVWHVQADGGPLELRLTTQSVNHVDPQTTEVTVFDGTNVIGAVSVSYTAAEAAANPLGWEKWRDLPLGPQAPGKVLRIESRVSGTPQTQTHYWLKFCGARWLALDSPSFKALEEDHAAYRFLVKPAEPLVLDLDNLGIPTPATDFAWKLLDPSGAVVGSGVQPIVAGPEFNIPGPAAGLWTLEMHPVGGEHYLLDKQGGADRHIYLDWHSGQRGRKVVEILMEGRPAAGIPFDVQMFRQRETQTGLTNDLIRQSLTSNGVVHFDQLPNGFYDVVVRPRVPGIGPVPPQVDLILCDSPVTNVFEFRGQPPQAMLDFGDAPGRQTLRADNGARHGLRPGWFLGRGVDSEPDGRPSSRAEGDDVNGDPDEEGVLLPSMAAPGTGVPVQVFASTNGVLNAWVDFNRDGDWSDAGERIFHLQPLVPGTNVLSFPVPSGAFNGLTFTRWRFFAPGAVDLLPVGPAPEGEVEDHPLEIGRPVEFSGRTHQPSGGATIVEENGTLVVRDLPSDGSGGVQIPAGNTNRRWLRFEFSPVRLATEGSRLVFSGTPTGPRGGKSGSNGAIGNLPDQVVLEGGVSRITMSHLLGSHAPREATIAWYDPATGIRGEAPFAAGARVAFEGDADVVGFMSLVPPPEGSGRIAGEGLRFSSALRLVIGGVLVGSGTDFNWFVRIPDGSPLAQGLAFGVEIRAALPSGSFVILGEAESGEPVRPILRAQRVSGLGIRFEFQPEPGRKHFLERAATPGGSWVGIGSRPGTFLLETWEVVPTETLELYRVRSSP